MEHRVRLGLAAAVPIILLSCLAQEPVTAALVDTLKSHVVYLAGDSLEGRLVGTPGIEKAAQYIADQFRSVGLQPAFGGLYFEDFEMELGFEVEDDPVLKIGDVGLSRHDQFEVLPVSGTGVITGPMVFAAEELPVDTNYVRGSVLFYAEDPAIEKERWTMMGRDGLLEWMRDVCGRASDLGARAVVFVNGSPERRRGQLHTFPVQRSHRPAAVPAFEIAYAPLAEALSGEGISLSEIFTSLGKEPPGGSKVLEGLDCTVEVTTKPRTIKARNVAGTIKGTGNRCIVVGAHFDHLGYGEIASSTPWRREIHNGADDNASGVAAVIEIARILSDYERPKHSVIFVCFTAEELGALGSEYYCKRPACSMDSTVSMINLDTIGRLEEKDLIVFGARSASEFGSLLEETNRSHSLELIQKEEIYGFSDQNPFYARGVPALHFFTGAHGDYHSPDDDWRKVNFEGLGSITSFVADFVRALDGAEAITPVVELEEASQAGAARGRGAFLGIVPDFTYGGSGVGIKGTVPMSPADAAGLEDGDVIVRIDGRPIANLQGLMTFLSGKNPGEEIKIQVLRGSSVVAKTATLSVRSPQE